MSPKFESTEVLKSTIETAPFLRVVGHAPYYREEIALSKVEGGQEAHSLHAVLPYPESFHPELANYLISRYSKKSQVVLDPFCGGGTTALQANLGGRVAYQSDVNPVALSIASAKLAPADLAEVTLSLQAYQLKRPIEMGPYADVFQYFYEIETFREIVNLRSILSRSEDRVHNFVKLIALSLLHGPSAGYFSTYTSPLISLSPDEQKEINYKRRQIPDYRAVLPRILRKAASILRDGIPSNMRQLAAHNRQAVCDARNLSYVPAGSVDLVVTGAPLPCSDSTLSDMWLKLWFLGVPANSLANRIWNGSDVKSWLRFMNEVCLELARVVKRGGRAAFSLSDIWIGRSVIELDNELIDMVTKELSRYWHVECVLTQKEKAPALTGAIRNKSAAGVISDAKVVVLRRS